MLVEKKDVADALIHWPYTTKTQNIGGKLVYAPFYFRWRAMLARCSQPTNDMYYLYGARGIKVCAEWDTNFWEFFKWCKENYIEGCTVDRIDNNGDYCPSNCRFATPKEQQSNSRITEAKRNATKKALQRLNEEPWLRYYRSERCPITGRFRGSSKT